MRRPGVLSASLACAALASLIWACQTVHEHADGDDRSASEAKAFDDPDAQDKGETDAPAALTASGGAQRDEPDDGKRFSLGALEDDDVRQAVYDSLVAQLGKTRDLGDGGDETTELGTAGDFRFTIVKLTNGRFDVSGGSHVAADGMDVEVSGWYKRTVKGEGEGGPTCTSFDAFVTVERKGSLWRLPPGTAPTIGREDSEDCF